MSNKKSGAQLSQVGTGQFCLALLCVALMFFATLAQALDSHELKLAGADPHASATRLTGGSPGFCLVCVAAHSPSVIAHVHVIYSVAKSQLAQTPVETSSHSLLAIFDLFVRPPPVA